MSKLLAILLCSSVAIIEITQCQAVQADQRTVNYPGYKKASTKRVTYNLVTDQEFPGTGDRAAWERARRVSFEGYKLLKEKRIDEALEKRKEAVSIYPYDPEIFNALGCTYYARGNKGDLDLGVEAIRRAAELKPDKCMFWDNLAKGLYELNKYQEALDALKKAKTCNPSPEKTSEIDNNLGIIESQLAKAASGKKL